MFALNSVSCLYEISILGEFLDVTLHFTLQTLFLIFFVFSYNLKYLHLWVEKSIRSNRMDLLWYLKMCDLLRLGAKPSVRLEILGLIAADQSLDLYRIRY